MPLGLATPKHCDDWHAQRCCLATSGTAENVKHSMSQPPLSLAFVHANPGGGEGHDDMARKYTADQFNEALHDPEVTTLAALCRRLGIVPCGGNYHQLEEYARQLGCDVLSHLPDTATHRRQAHWRGIDEEQIAGAVRASRTGAEAMRRLGVAVTPSGYRKLRAWVDKNQADVSHWHGRAWARGRERPELRVSFYERSTNRRTSNTSQLRALLIRDGLKEHRCEWCRRLEWSGQPIPLELDHVNGDRADNRLENLRLLCPNCHAQTATYRGRNIGKRHPDRPG